MGFLGMREVMIYCTSSCSNSSSRSTLTFRHRFDCAPPYVPPPPPPPPAAPRPFHLSNISPSKLHINQVEKIEINGHSSPCLFHKARRHRLLSTAQVCRWTRRTKVSNNENPQPNGSSRKANLAARRRERITLPTYVDGAGRNLPISEFLTHSSGVEAMLNSRSLQNFQALDADTYRCTLQTIQFMSFEVAPVIDLRLTYTTTGCTVEMLSCKLEGSEALRQQNDLFSAFMSNVITWEETSSEPFLDFDVLLKVTLQVYTKPFTMLPLSAVETPGNVIMQGVVDRLVPLFIQQLLDKYRAWVTATVESTASIVNAT